MTKIITAFVIVFMTAMSLSGCLNTRAGRGAVYGGVAGGLIGGLSTGRAGGAVAGAAVGAVAGHFIGAHSYRCKKTGIFGNTYWGTCLR